MNKEKSCGAIIINDKDEILIIQHKKGHWAFPKGHVENNETEIETALREVKEETNLDIKILEQYKCKTTYSPKKDTVKDVIYFIGINPTGSIKMQEEEVIQYKWVKIDECYNGLTYDNDKKLLKDIYSKYKSEKI